MDTETELHYRQTTLRAEIAAELKEAAELGDINRENFPFDAAREKQELNERRIRQLFQLVKSAQAKSVQSQQRAVIGSTLNLRKENGELLKLTLVDEVNFRGNQQLSISSPLGRAVLGKKIGSSFSVKLPGGNVVRCELQEIE